MLVVGCFPFSLQRILPDPIAFFPVFRTIFLERNLPAVIRFIPTDGIKQEFPIIRAAIMQRLAADDVVREFLDELRHESVERFRIFAVCEVIPFERAGNLALIRQRLISCGYL